METKYDSLIAVNADKYNVPFTWIKAVIATESSFNPNAYRAEKQINDASRGLMQLLLQTARNLGYTGVPDGLFDPMVNIGLGAKLLAQLQARYGSDFSAVYAVYNSGQPDPEYDAEVAAHVAAANRNLDAVLAELPGSEITVTAEPEEGGEAGGWSIGGILLAAAVGAAIYYFMK